MRPYPLYKKKVLLATSKVHVYIILLDTKFVYHTKCLKTVVFMRFYRIYDQLLETLLVPQNTL
nr:MAG TPA: hypothetical protein [Bacteriophage sp.]